MWISTWGSERPSQSLGRCRGGCGWPSIGTDTRTGSVQSGICSRPSTSRRSGPTSTTPSAPPADPTSGPAQSRILTRSPHLPPSTGRRHDTALRPSLPRTKPLFSARCDHACHGSRRQSSIGRQAVAKGADFGHNLGVISRPSRGVAALSWDRGPSLPFDGPPSDEPGTEVQRPA